MKIKELSVFIVYRAPETYAELKTAIKDYENESKAYRSFTVFPVGSPSTSAASDVVNNATRVMVQRDSRVRNVEWKIYSLTK